MNINGIKLDDYQMNAIKSNNKSTLVCAGAGSGKTLTIMGYIKYLIDELNINEKEILVISFTNETVKSLKDKLLNIGINTNVYTFHSFANSIIKNKYSLISDNYLDYIIDEYFYSFDLSKHMSNYIVGKLKLNKNDYNNLKRLISTFIRLAKSNLIDEYNILDFYNQSILNEKKLLKIILDIYIIYKRDLQSQYKIDFDDLIYLATKDINSSNIAYKYIIIDEFQDTSLVRYQLIKEVINKCNSNIFVVGDDYQSIYRFSGCDLDLFINFNKYFNNPIRYDLKYTYRNSNELIYVSSNFIMKNKHQLKKDILSNKNINKPIKIIYSNDINKVLNIVNDKDTLILTRNNNDLKFINHDNKLTIHKSKGLEANNVILYNSDSIPCKIKNEDILRYVTNSKDYILYEEERRLFYVALTRTKNNIYIMVHKKISPFVKELISNYSEYIDFIY